ncbi:hypothetical protein V8F06_012285 [Rhypophila decipiens]
MRSQGETKKGEGKQPDPDHLVHRMRGGNVCTVEAFVTYRIDEGYHKIWKCCRCHSTVTVINDKNTGLLYCNDGHWGLAFVTKANSIAGPTKSDMGGPELFATVGQILRRMKEEKAGWSQPELEIKSNHDTLKGTTFDDRRRAGKERDHRRDGPSSNYTEQPEYDSSRKDTRPAYKSNASTRPSTRSREDGQPVRDAPPQQSKDPNTKGPTNGQDIATNSTTYPSAGMSNVGGPPNNGYEDTRDRGRSDHHRAEIPAKKSSALLRDSVIFIGFGKLFGKTKRDKGHHGDDSGGSRKHRSGR